jgi:hypothetical protein
MPIRDAVQEVSLTFCTLVPGVSSHLENYVGRYFMSDKNENNIRKARNEQLIRRMKAGEPLWSYDSKASWFPPRPIIEKDQTAIKRLYNDKSSKTSGTYADPTVKHIESRLKLVSSESADSKVDDAG